MSQKQETVIEPFSIDYYDEAVSLWKRTAGMGLSSADERAPLGAFLEKNPGLSFAAWTGGTLVGTALCGTDGRRGFLYHLAVDTAYRRRGIGTELVRRSLAALHAAGVEKCHLFVILGNEIGAAFWEKDGWTLRKDLLTFSKLT